jgi:hypothetical protein
MDDAASISQALSLLNDPFLIEQARLWASRVRALGGDADSTLDRAYQMAFARRPTELERRAALDFMAARSSVAGVEDAWAALCHVLLNTKEFLVIE